MTSRCSLRSASHLSNSRQQTICGGNTTLSRGFDAIAEAQVAAKTDVQRVIKQAFSINVSASPQTGSEKRLSITNRRPLSQRILSQSGNNRTKSECEHSKAQKPAPVRPTVDALYTVAICCSHNTGVSDRSREASSSATPWLS